MNLVDCVNCGKQTMVDLEKPGDKCEFCGKNAREKESITVEENEEKEITEADQAIYKSMGRVARSGWLKEHASEIERDICSMSRQEVLDKWPFSKETYAKLKRLYAPDLKVRMGRKPREAPGVAKEPEKASPKEEHEMTDVERLAEANILIAFLRGYQEAAQDFFGKKRSGEQK